MYDRETKPGLVALYDIRPGNGAGLFLQPRSPHGAYMIHIHDTICTDTSTYIYHHDPHLMVGIRAQPG